MEFIRATDEYTVEGKSIPAPYIRKDFEIDFSPVTAKIRIAASGFYELYVNGKNITKGYIAPYISNPSDILCYDDYDVAGYLTRGKNAIGIILGNGYANQTVKGWDYDKASFRAPLCCALELVAENENQTLVLTSDESFKVHPSHIIYDMYRFGTHIDARLCVKGWNEPDFDDSSWQNAKKAVPPCENIIPCTASPIVKIDELKPIKITEQKDICYLKTSLHGGEDIPETRVSGYLYDFGKSCAGVCRLKIRGARGQTVTVRHGEKLSDDGTFTLNSIHTIGENTKDSISLLQTDVYTLSGDGEEIFVPPFTYHGFRYAFVEGISAEQATEDLLTFEVISSDVKKRSSFSCSDETVNLLYDMAINADRSNLHYFPTDCPHREKNGWTGDIAVSTEQLLLSFECSEELRLWLKMVCLAQKEDGSLPGIVPTTGWGFSWGNGPMWDSALISVPYYIYKYDGRCDVLYECSDAIYRYLNYVASRRDEKGLVSIGLGDWCEPRRNGVPISSPLVLTDSLTVYDIAKKSAFIFEVTKECERAKFASRLADEIKCSIREHLIDQSRALALGNCQTSQTMIISHGVLSDSEKAKAYKKLIDIILKDGEHVRCGMIGLRYIFEVLTASGDVDLALKMICRDDEPSYGSMIKRGATALCEALMENGINESENHHFFADIIRIFISYISGLQINPDACDVKCVIFSPKIPSDMTFAKGSYAFSTGVSEFGWEKCESGIKAYITLPDEIHGKFIYAEKEAELHPGYQEFFLN